ncbi:GNAT family N-acetyltransferase [Atopococcus tabaci]|uniref:GNAT family N-acetyltransferase n=1 Tax=Atopococcus tabaci TaxID=269774 RepID=UPI0024093A69|nr:GNAT family N-acetyltransferase [Atopococcus tabaci]
MAMIVQARAADAGAIAALAEEIWREHYTLLLGEDQVTYMLDTIQSEDVIRQAIESGTVYWLVKENDELIGYVAYDLRESELFLSKYYLKHSFRGRGIGRYLFDELKQVAIENRLPAIELTVNRENTRSIEAYRALGFHVLREHVGDIGGGYVMDDYVMQYVIS